MAEQRTTSLVRRFVWLTLFLAPIANVARIVSTANHEILGHGLAAVAVGGEFRGFILEWDGMGWALTELASDASTTDHIIHRAAGITANVLMGLVCLVLAYALRNRVIIRLSLLLLSFACLMGSMGYVLWNSYHPVPPGDVGQIIILWRLGGLPGATMIRNVLLIVSGIMYVPVRLFLYALILQAIEQALLGGERLSPRARFWILLAFVVTPEATALAMSSGDSQIAPGIGWLPSIARAASTVFCAIVLYFFSRKPNPRVPATTITWRHLLVSWGSLIIVMSMTLLWFQNGVTWG